MAHRTPPSDELHLRINRAAEALSKSVDYDANYWFLYATFFRPLRRFFSGKGCSPDKCDDLTQETFLRIYIDMKKYRHQGRFEGWLYKVATTTYLKQIREAGAAKRSAPQVPYEDVPDAAVSRPASQLKTMLDAEDRDSLRQAIDTLPKQMRQCLKLHLYQNRSYAEVAVVMKININTVKAHMFQGRKKLQDMLDSEDEER